MRVLVTDSDTRPALAAVRALGRQGHEVVTAGVRHPSLASVSRYARGFEPYPDPTHAADTFMPAIAEIVKRHDIGVLLPMTEVTTLLTTRHRDMLPTGCALPFADSEVIARASDKAQMLALAEKLGVPVPRSAVADSANDALGQLRNLSWPTVIKPSRSRVRVGDGWQSSSVGYAVDEDELATRLKNLPDTAFPVLLQEKIEGPGVGVFMCFDSGRAIAVFAHRRLREKPPSGGVSVLCESVAADADAVEHADRLLTALDWHGVAMVEFKRDRRDGSLRLMEINARFWGSLQLAIAAGVDFPQLLVELAEGRQPNPIEQYDIGVRCRWLAGDLDALLIRLLQGERRLNLPPGHPGRLRSVWHFLKFAGRKLRYEVEQRDDPAPARLEWGRRFFPAGRA